MLRLKILRLPLSGSCFFVNAFVGLFFIGCISSTAQASGFAIPDCQGSYAGNGQPCPSIASSSDIASNYTCQVYGNVSIGGAPNQDMYQLENCGGNQAYTLCAANVLCNPQSSTTPSGWVSFFSS